MTTIQWLAGVLVGFMIWIMLRSAWRFLRIQPKAFWEGVWWMLKPILFFVVFFLALNTYWFGGPFE